jgi:cysteine synthase
MPEATEFVYGGGTAYGYAQIALAIACTEYGKKFTMFLAKRKKLHPYTQHAVDCGANLIELDFGMLSVTRARAREYAASTPGCVEVPLGLNTPEVIEAIGTDARRIDRVPTEVWCACASGTLARALHWAWPDAEIHGVCVGHKPTADEAGTTILHQHPRKFQQDVLKECAPPYPSVPNYDAKVWQFAQRFASDDALIWNVAA